MKAELEQSIQRLTAEVEVKRAEEARARGMLTRILSYLQRVTERYNLEIWEHTASLDAERLELRKQSRTSILPSLFRHHRLTEILP